MWRKSIANFEKITGEVKSIKAKKGGLKHNNNHIERHNGKIKDRIKVMRGGFRSFEGAKAFLNLRDIIYNFVHSHQDNALRAL